MFTAKLPIVNYSHCGKRHHLFLFFYKKYKIIRTPLKFMCSSIYSISLWNHKFHSKKSSLKIKYCIALFVKTFKWFIWLTLIKKCTDCMIYKQKNKNPTYFWLKIVCRLCIDHLFLFLIFEKNNFQALDFTNGCQSN